MAKKKKAKKGKKKNYKVIGGFMFCACKKPQPGIDPHGRIVCGICKHLVQDISYMDIVGDSAYTAYLESPQWRPVKKNKKRR
jgi:hypothetical protein